MAEERIDEINEEENDDIVELSTLSGQKYQFFIIDVISYKGDLHYLLQPVELLEGMSEDEVIVFKKVETDGVEHYELVEDDEIVSHVIDVHNEKAKRLA